MTLVADDGETLDNVASAHRVPAIAEAYRAYLAGLAVSRHRTSAIAAEVIRSGVPKLVPVVDPAALVAQMDATLAPLAARLDVRSYVVVPIRARNAVLGSLSLFRSGADGRSYGPDDLVLAEDIADRAGLALSNARLYDEQAIAQRELDERLNAGHEAEANLRAAQASLQSAKLNLSYTQVRAPVAGRIGKLEVTVGNLVAAGPGAPVLTTLVSVSPIYASFDADEQVIGRALRDMPGGASARSLIGQIPVQMGTAATDGTPFEGKLQLIDNQVDAKSGTVRVRATFENKDGALIPGQFARIRMGQAQESKALLVAERAVGTDQNKKFVMVVNADNKAEYREVTLGAPINGLRVVASGLKPGERIVVNGLQHVRPGVLVDPKVVPMDATAQGNAKAGKLASNP